MSNIFIFTKSNLFYLKSFFNANLITVCNFIKIYSFKQIFYKNIFHKKATGRTA